VERTAEDTTARGVRRVLLITLGLNLFVAIAKIVVGRWSRSRAMEADGYHSLVDSSNNLIGLTVAAFAFRPADVGHPYGHRKFETAATLAIGLALLALAYQLLESAFEGALHRVLPELTALNWIVLVVTLGVNLFVSSYEARAGRRLGSDYLIADAAHTRSDLYVSLAVLGSFAAARAGLGWADPIVAVAIAALIGVQAISILVRSFHVLTDRAVLDAGEIERLIAAVPGVARSSNVRTRGRADAVYIDLVAFVDGGLSLNEAHAIADAIEAAVTAARPEVVDVVVHLEPA